MPLRWDDSTDPNNPPKRWHAPVYGSGMTVTGTEDPDEHDCGVRFGYCYQPQSYSEPSAGGFVTTQSYTRHGFNPELQEADPDPKWNTGHHPYYATEAEAVQWLKDRNLDGQVQRYAHHKGLADRGPVWDFEPICREYRWKQYQPWLTAGVTAHVTTRQDQTCSAPLEQIRGFELHQPDGSVVHVGGSSALYDRVMEAYENCDHEP